MYILSKYEKNSYLSILMVKVVCLAVSSDNAQIFCANDFKFLYKQNWNSFQGHKKSSIWKYATFFIIITITGEVSQVFTR